MKKLQRSEAVIRIFRNWKTSTPESLGYFVNYSWLYPLDYTGLFNVKSSSTKA